MDLSGKLAIITGASRGIGRALAIELAKSNCSLLLTALEGDELSVLCNELESQFPPQQCRHEYAKGSKDIGPFS
jgi:short-subunit dehydrogenase